jgi:hypothetical protein
MKRSLVDDDNPINEACTGILHFASQGYVLTILFRRAFLLMNLVFVCAEEAERIVEAAAPRMKRSHVVDDYPIHGCTPALWPRLLPKRPLLLHFAGIYVYDLYACIRAGKSATS